MASVVVLDGMDDLARARASSFVCVVMHSLPTCAVCEKVAPLYRQFPAAFPSAMWCESSKVHGEDVTSFPTFEVFRRGHLVLRLTGGSELGALQVAVRECLRAKVMAITEDVVLLDWQPNEEQLSILKQQTGAKTIINLRDASEKGYISAKEEAEKVPKREQKETTEILAGKKRLGSNILTKLVSWTFRTFLQSI
jgi:hypothetical protein